MAEPADAGRLTSLRRDVARNAARARNGVKWATGSEWAPLNPTPSDIIWRRGKAHVRHYRRDTPPRYSVPILAYLGLVGRSHLFDLYKGGSIAQMLMDYGFDVYVLDWGEPDELDTGNTLETYLSDLLPAAIDATCAESGSPDVDAFAYCMGGVMTVHALAAQPRLPIHSLVVLSAPFDWSDLGPLVDAVRSGKIGLDEMVDGTGNVPGSMILKSFTIRRPTAEIVNYVNLWQNLWNDRYVEGYQAIGRFLNDHVYLARGVAEQMLEQWMRNNGFVNDSLRFHGQPVSLAGVTTPVLSVIAERDDIAPVQAASAIADVLPNASVELLTIDTGHVSLFVGRDAVKVVMPTIFEWIAARSRVT